MAQDFDILQPQDFVLGTQVKLIQLAREKGRIDGVWYGGGESAGQDRCVELTGYWIERMATAIDDPFTEEDERFAGFRKNKSGIDSQIKPKYFRIRHAVHHNLEWFETA